MTIEMDPSTGLPTLPDGYYWRVEDTHDVLHLWWRVALMKKRKRLWDKRVDSDDIWNPLDFERLNREEGWGWKHYSDYVWGHAVQVYKRTFRDSLKLTQLKKDYLGDYPPRNLLDVEDA